MMQGYTTGQTFEMIKCKNLEIILIGRFGAQEMLKINLSMLKVVSTKILSSENCYTAIQKVRKKREIYNLILLFSKEAY